MAVLNVEGASLTYYERPESPKESFGNQEFTVTRVFDVLWDYRWLFCAGMMGYPRLRVSQYLDDEDVLLNGPQYVSRVTPVGYRTSGLLLEGKPEGPWMYPTSYTMEPVGKCIGVDVNGVAKYDLARVSLNYQTLTYSIRSDQEMKDQKFYKDGLLDPDEGLLGRYITKHFQPTAEYLTLPFGGLHWVQQGSLIPITGSVGRIISATEITMIWHQVPGIPRAIYTHVGSVNHDKFPDFNRNNDLPENINVYGRGTLLLLAVDIKPYKWFLGQKLYDITYKFKYFQPIIQSTIFDHPLNHDQSLDVNNQPIQELYGHNHFLRFKPNEAAPSRYEYQMITHNAARPKVSGALELGQTVYPYKDFSDLFFIEDPDLYI